MYTGHLYCTPDRRVDSSPPSYLKKNVHIVLYLVLLMVDFYKQFVCVCSSSWFFLILLCAVVEKNSLESILKDEILKIKYQ